MIMARNEDGTYSQVGFVKDNVGIDTEYIYDKDGDIVFEKGFTRETSGTVPLTINGIEKDLKSWSITGKNGTPTPENSVEVQAVGDRTANLFDKSVASINAYPAANGTISSNPNTRTTYCVCKPNTTYTISKIASKRFIVAYIKTMPAIGENYYGNISDIEATEITITTGADALFLIVFYYHASYDTLTESEIKNSIMVVEGSTSLPYEPYGYKIPVVTSADGTEPITTPIYLPTPLYSGEVMRSDGTIARSDGTTETFTAPQIPTLNGTTVIDVDTAVKPESIYIEYK